VNDTFQHDVGDEVLKGIASEIKSACQFKGKCYRYGGDEIAVLLPNHTAAEAYAVAERIRASVARVRFEGYPNQMTLSIGVAAYPGSCPTSDRLFKCADQAMYDAKQNGKNQVRVADA
jgi:diguanylate cyclase (GGDEF)-like protein